MNSESDIQTSASASTPPPRADHIPSMAGRELTFIRDWEEWKRIWNTTTCAEKLLGLLHVGFDVPRSQGESHKGGDRVVFYLDLADGFAEAVNNFENKPKRAWQSTLHTSFGDVMEGSVRKHLARKAMAVLCKCYFGLKKPEGRMSSGPEWACHLFNEAVVEKTIWFFRPERGFCSIRNIVHINNDQRLTETLEGFLREFCRLFFEFRSLDEDRERDTDKELQKKLRAMCHRLIPVMEKMKMTNLLLKHAHDIDQKSIDALTAIVMGMSLSFPGESLAIRTPRSVEEACCGNRGISGVCQSAFVLNTLLTVQKGLKNLAEIQELEKKKLALESERRQTEQKLQQLAGTPAD